MNLFYNENDIEAGIDEVARGCLLGRVYTCAVIWNKEKQRYMDYESIDEGYYKNVQKVMGGKYSRDETLRKIKFKLFNYLKFNLKNITQYEFTF